MSTRRAIVRLVTVDSGGAADSFAHLSPGHTSKSMADELTVESPLNLVVDGDIIATLMRTPGHDLELAAGWLVVESGVRRAVDVIGLRQCRTDDDLNLRADATTAGRGVDQVHLTLASGVTPPRPRAWVTSASCGVCSADVLDLSPLRWSDPHQPGWSVPAAVLQGLPERLRDQQRTFNRTGSLHAAALALSSGDLLTVREDVGRHNAVDKAVGWALLNEKLPARDLLLVVSGRVSFEIVQKAVAAGVAGIVAVSAPSDLAVDLARQHELLLAGMIRAGRMNLYSGADWVSGRD